MDDRGARQELHRAVVGAREHDEVGRGEGHEGKGGEVMRTFGTLVILAVGLFPSLCASAASARSISLKKPRAHVVRRRAEVEIVSAQELVVEPTTRAPAEPPVK